MTEPLSESRMSEIERNAALFDATREQPQDGPQQAPRQFMRGRNCMLSNLSATLGGPGGAGEWHPDAIPNCTGKARRAARWQRCVRSRLRNAQPLERLLAKLHALRPPRGFIAMLCNCCAALPRTAHAARVRIVTACAPRTRGSDTARPHLALTRATQRADGRGHRLERRHRL